MKVLYIATSFPEASKGSTIYTDLAETINEAGYDITVVVSEQSKNKKHTEMKKERGFDVLRIVTGNYYDVGFIEKGITTLRMPVIMRRGISKYLEQKTFDMILFESPPVTNAGLVFWAKKKFNCPAYLMLKDIFPQNAVDLKIIKPNGMLFKYFREKERKLYETADIIGCMSEANKDYIIEHNPWLNVNKIEIFPNTKKLTSDIECTEFQMRRSYGIPKEACVFLFGGNMGRPQSIDFLCKAVERCKDEKNIFFLFVGRGTDRYKLENVISRQNIKNALVIKNQVREDYEEIMKECDVGLIVLDKSFTIPNYPSRILSYMEYAKPVLAATDKVSDIKNLIEDGKFGEWVWSGDVDGFVEKIKSMAASTELKIKGSNGRRFIENNFNVEKSLEILERHFKQM